MSVDVLLDNLCKQNPVINEFVQVIDTFEAYMKHQAIQNKIRDERTAFLRWNPEQATTADIRFLCERIQDHEDAMNRFYAFGAIRPRHEWDPDLYKVVCESHGVKIYCESK